MSLEQLKAFMEKVKEDKALEGKLAALPKCDTEASQQEYLEIAREAGFTINLEDLPGCDALEDDDLDNVAGGTNQEEFDPGNKKIFGA